MMSTYVPSGKNLEAERKWYVIDAAGLTVGRLASEVALLLMGKRNPKYTPFLDVGDHVIIVNAEKVVFTGNKLNDKFYRHYTFHPGGLREISAKDQLQKHPERVLTLAVKGMLPKTKLGRAMASKLKVCIGPTHPHQAQQPIPLEFK
ncbi:MAG: 50S ribosomal protein L13 [Acidobacteria bacterium]|nr:50S ribosomal protein L13 [Acidobacteriota bacterium]